MKSSASTSDKSGLSSRKEENQGCDQGLRQCRKEKRTKESLRVTYTPLRIGIVVHSEKKKRIPEKEKTKGFKFHSLGRASGKNALNVTARSKIAEPEPSTSFQVEKDEREVDGVIISTKRKKSVTFDEPQIQGILNYPSEPPKHHSFFKVDKIKSLNNIIQKTLSRGKVKSTAKNENHQEVIHDTTFDKNGLHIRSCEDRGSLLKSQSFNRDSREGLRCMSTSLPNLEEDFSLSPSALPADEETISVLSVSSAGTSKSKFKSLSALSIKKFKNFHSKNPIKAIKKAVFKNKDQNFKTVFPSRSYDDILRENNFPTQAEYHFDNENGGDFEVGDFDDDINYYNIKRTSVWSTRSAGLSEPLTAVKARDDSSPNFLTESTLGANEVSVIKEHPDSSLPRIEVISVEDQIFECASDESINGKTESVKDAIFGSKKKSRGKNRGRSNTNSSVSSSFEERSLLSSLHKIVRNTSSLSLNEERKYPSKENINKQMENSASQNSSPQSSPNMLIRKVQKLQAKVSLLRTLSDFGPLPSTPPPPKPPRSHKLSTGSEQTNGGPDPMNGFRRFSLVDADCDYLTSKYAKQARLDVNSGVSSKAESIPGILSRDDDAETYMRFSLYSSSDEGSLNHFHLHEPFAVEEYNLLSSHKISNECSCSSSEGNISEGNENGCHLKSVQSVNQEDFMPVDTEEEFGTHECSKTTRISFHSRSLDSFGSEISSTFEGDLRRSKSDFEFINHNERISSPEGNLNRNPTEAASTPSVDLQRDKHLLTTFFQRLLEKEKLTYPESRVILPPQEEESHKVNYTDPPEDEGFEDELKGSETKKTPNDEENCDRLRTSDQESSPPSAKLVKQYSWNNDYIKTAPSYEDIVLSEMCLDNFSSASKHRRASEPSLRPSDITTLRNSVEISLQRHLVRHSTI